MMTPMPFGFGAGLGGQVSHHLVYRFGGLGGSPNPDTHPLQFQDTLLNFLDLSGNLRICSFFFCT